MTRATVAILLLALGLTTAGCHRHRARYQRAYYVPVVAVTVVNGETAEVTEWRSRREAARIARAERAAARRAARYGNPAPANTIVIVMPPDEQPPPAAPAQPAPPRDDDDD